MTRAVLCRPPVKGGSEPKASGGLVLRFTKRLLHPLAHPIELPHYLGIRKADHAQPERLEGSRSRRIGPHTRDGEMAIAIDLDHEPQLGAIEVRDIRTQWLLAGEFFRPIAQKLEPELALGRACANTAW